MLTIIRATVATAVIILLAAVLSACTPQTSGRLGHLQTLANSCPTAEFVQYVGYDFSGSGQEDTIRSSREAVLKDIATKVAVCSGHLRVVVFTGSAAASQVVFEADLKPAGATEIARLRKVDDLVASAMESINAGLADAAGTLSADGSDITAQFGLAAEYGEQMAATSSIALTVDLLTDGVQTVGVVLNTETLTTSTASDLANRAPTVELPATAVVKVSGLGKTAGTPPPTAYVDAIKTFYLTFCQRTGVASCVAVTDYSS